METALNYFSCAGCCTAPDDSKGAQTIECTAPPEYPGTPQPARGPDNFPEGPSPIEGTSLPEHPRPRREETEETLLGLSPGKKKVADDDGCSKQVAAVCSSDTFTAVIAKSDGCVLGMDMSIAGGTIARVTGVTPGPIQAWNEQAEKTRKIREGDILMEVNGVRGNTQEMLQKLRDDSSLTLVVKRRPEFTVKISKGTSLLGLDIQCQRTREGLVVHKLKDGVVKTWNEANPDRPIREGDRIVEINGFDGEARQLLQKLKESTELDLVVAPSP